MKKLNWEDFWEICQKQCPKMDYEFATDQWERGVNPKAAGNAFNRHNAKKTHFKRHNQQDFDEGEFDNF